MYTRITEEPVASEQGKGMCVYLQVIYSQDATGRSWQNLTTFDRSAIE